MKKLTAVSAGVAFAVMGGAAQAATFTFDLTASSGTLLGEDHTFYDGVLGLDVADGESGSSTQLYHGKKGLGIAVPPVSPTAKSTLVPIGGSDELILSFDADVTITAIEFGGMGQRGPTGAKVNEQAEVGGLMAGGANITFTNGDAPGDILSGSWALASGNEFTVSVGNATDTIFVKSITVESSAVPIPAAAWLFGSALAGIVGLRRRKQ